MIKIAITEAAFAAIAKTLALGSVKALAYPAAAVGEGNDPSRGKKAATGLPWTPRVQKA